jgi:hypothetical protein
MSLDEVLAELRKHATVDVPTAGWALGKLSRNSSYLAAANGTLGVPVFNVGGKKRVASVAVLRALGLAESVADASAADALKTVASVSAVASPSERKRAAQTRFVELAQRKREEKATETAKALFAKLASGELVLTERTTESEEI